MRVFSFDAVDSTNEVAKRLFANGELRERTCILAREQTRGKGTRGRTWCSPRDAGIYVTFADPTPRMILPSTAELTLAAGVACVEVLSTMTGLPIRLKPINDLMVDDRKLGGILTECSIQGSVLQAVFTGIGINMTRADRPVSGHSPVCLEELLTHEVYRALSWDALITALGQRVGFLQNFVYQGDVEYIRSRWAECLSEVHCVGQVAPATMPSQGQVPRAEMRDDFELTVEPRS